MHKLTRMRISRDEWKNKARQRAEQLREARKTHRRQQHMLDRLKEENAVLKQSVSEKKGA
jgi:hypothetical protein